MPPAFVMQRERRAFTVRPAAEGAAWLVEEPGDERPQQFATRDDAVEAGKTLAQAHGPSTLQVRDRAGGIEAEMTFEEDPLVTQLEKFGF
jgi:hypothetical protein